MTIPQYEEMKMPLLKRLGELTPGVSLSADEMRAFVVDHFALSEEDVSKMWKRVPEYSGQMQWALTDMALAGIIKRPERGRYAISDEGRRILENGETDLSRPHLKEAYPSFAAFVNDGNNSADEEVQEESSEETPVDLGKLNAFIVRYRKALADNWHEESYKWKAVKRFQDEWDIEAPDFASMLDRALDKTYNLLVSGNYYARNMISKFAHENPEKTRAMFRALYNESENFDARMEAFAAEAETFRDEPTYDGWNSTYQDARAVSAYLWLRYPDKYYLYKYTVFRDVAKAINSDFVPKKGGISKNVLGGYKMFDYVRSVLSADDNIISTIASLLDGDCYPDPEYITLTADFGFYVSSNLSNETEIDASSLQVAMTEKEGDDASPGCTGFLSAEYDQGDNDQTAEPYGRDRFLEEVFMSEVAYNKLATLLKRKKNVILQGAPGTGKTFAAERLAWSLMGEKDGSRVQVVQFHQSTSYEEFICGYRPDSSGNFMPKTGLFVDFCDRAASDPDKKYFFIIDEINRANISKVFGELLMLIEADKRDHSVTLPVVNRAFSVPENVYLLGMMNTADRGLALIDYALRRRFAFFEMEPAVGTQRFESYVEALENEKLSRLVDAVAKLNGSIVEDDTLGRGFRIGHSYFCLSKGATDEDVESVVEYEIAPLLEEYWFDNPKKAEDEIAKLRAEIA